MWMVHAPVGLKTISNAASGGDHKWEQSSAGRGVMLENRIFRSRSVSESMCTYLWRSPRSR